MSISYKNIQGTETKQKQLEVLETNTAEDGSVITKYNLNNCLTKEISLFLHFGAKWIILSEVHFSSETVDAHYTENTLNTLNEQPPQVVDNTKTEQKLKQNNKNEESSNNSEEKLTTTVARKEEKVKDEPNSVVPIGNGDSSQMYIGITIGILSMSVLLLLFTIFFMLRKNKHRIFSKHSSE